MELDFFKSKLIDKGIEAIVPNDKEREFLHQTILEELAKGIVTEQTKQRYLSIIANLINNGEEGIILGCAEMPLII